MMAKMVLLLNFEETKKRTLLVVVLVTSLQKARVEVCRSFMIVGLLLARVSRLIYFSSAWKEVVEGDFFPSCLTFENNSSAVVLHFRI